MERTDELVSRGLNLSDALNAKSGLVRVLLLGNFISHKRPGAFWVCESLAEMFRGAGWRVVASSSCSGRLARLVGMCVTIIKSRRTYDIALVDVYSGRAFFLAEFVCRLLAVLGTPFVLSLHGGRLPEFASKNPERVKRLLTQAAKVTAPSAWMAREMRRYRDGIIELHNPIDLSLYRTSRCDQVRPKLVWLRSFESFYCPEMALDVVDQLKNDYPELSLVMIGRDKGDGTLGKVQQEIERRQLSTIVEIVPGVPKEDVPRYLAEGDIFLNTSSIDNAPVCLVEALASGALVVSTRVGGIPDLIEDGRNGVLVEAGDVSAMTRAIERLLDDPLAAVRMRAAGLASVANWDAKAVLEKWGKILSPAPLSIDREQAGRRGV